MKTKKTIICTIPETISHSTGGEFRIELNAIGEVRIRNIYEATSFVFQPLEADMLYEFLKNHRKYFRVKKSKSAKKF